jgi:hypothetical protein
MRADGPAFLVRAAAAGICVTLAGCASGAATLAPAASSVTATRQAETQRPGHAAPGHAAPGHAARPPQGSAADTAAGTGRPSAQPPPASRRKVAAKLTSGLYTDGQDGTPHYTLSFTSGRGGVLTGSASFMYQDGRIATAGSYAGSLSGNGKVTLTFGDGKALSGKYAAGRLDLASCAAVLPMAAFLGGCSFAYHGHVP